MSKLTRLLRRNLLRFKNARVWQGIFTPIRYANGILPATVAPGDRAIYSSASPADCNFLSYPGHTNVPESVTLESALCTKHHLSSPAFRFWARKLGEQMTMHRKLWEFCFVLQALYERGMLAEGKRGLGFAVGEEPLPALMASMGCSILASDLDAADERAAQWAETAQLASTLESLNARNLCDSSKFRERVSFRPIDMNRIPEDVRGFDFAWSSCSFEHCGSIELGKRFLQEQMKCLKPGGIAVHTTEFNLSSLDETIREGSTVIYRRQDIEEMVRALQSDGHRVEPLQLDLGDSKEDAHVDVMPYSDNRHLKLELAEKYISTSIALIIQKADTAQCDRNAA